MRNELTDNEKKVFEQLQKEAKPNPELRNRIVHQLKSDGLVRPDKARRIWLNWAASIAACILFFFLGQYVAYTTTNIEPWRSYIDPQHGFAIILYEDDNFVEGEALARAAEYGEWMHSISEQGIRIQGQELTSESTTINATGSSERVMSGYFLLEANTLEEAVEIASDIPHVKYGGSVEVKKFINR